MSPATKASFVTHRGPDFLSSDLTRDDNYFSDWLNCQHRDDGAIQKRDGNKAVAPTRGGCGLYTHRKRNQITGEESAELLTIGAGRLSRAIQLQMVITYVGAASEVLVTYFYDPSVSQYRFKILADGVAIINELVGIGIEEGGSFPIYSMNSLSTLINAHADLTSTIIGSGASTTSAAFLFPTQYNYSLISNESLTLRTYIWEDVNAPLSDLFSLAETAKDTDPNFELISATNWDALSYFADPYNGLMKYDGQTCYRAGVPKASITGLAATAAVGNNEVTSIVCTADVTLPEISQVQFIDGNNSWDSSNQNSLFIIYDSVGSVGVRFRRAGGPGGPVPGVDRAINVVYQDGDTNAQVAAKAQNAINPDGEFNCTVLGDTITITAATNGVRADITTTNVDTFNVTVLQQGSAGLSGLYFVLGDVGGGRAFWFDVNNAGTPEPAHGQPFSTEITTIVTNDTAATVATKVELIIEAEAGFTSTVASNTITATATPVGTRVDGSSGTTLFTVSTTSQGADAGLGIGTFTYHATYEQRDAQGIFTEGDFSDDKAIVLSAANQNVALTLPTITDDSGFNTGCAIVNGNQSGILTINVDGGHTLKAGDQVFIHLAPASAIAQVETITTGADVSNSLDAKYFYLYSRYTGSERSTAFWIDVSNNGTPEPAHGAPDSQEITTILPNDTAATVATKIAATINARAEWNATSLGSVITVTHAILGDVSDGFDGNTTFTFALTTNGVNAQVGEGVIRLVESVTATTITLTQDSISVLDNAVISNGLRIKIWRTETNGPGISKFLVDTLPNNSFVSSILYTDAVLDVDLGEEWVEPEFTHGLPPATKYVTVWNKVLVLGGRPSSPSTIYYSIPFEFSPEYFPEEANNFPVYSNYGDQIRGLYALQDGVMVFKDRSYFPITGDIFTGQIRIDKRAQGDIQYISHNSMLESRGSLLFADKKGVFTVDNSTPPAEASEKIRPKIVNNFNLFDPRRVVGFHDRTQYRLFFMWPALRRLPNDDLVVDEDLSFVTVYNALHQSWYIWDFMDFSGGMVEFDGDILFVGWRENALGDRVHTLRRLSREPNNPHSFNNHNFPIEAFVKTSWYAGSSPSVLKSFTFVKFYAEGDLTSVLQNVLVETERDLQSGSVHTRFEWDSLSRPNKQFRLRPSKLKRLRFIMSNEDYSTNIVVTGWELIGSESPARNDLVD